MFQSIGENVVIGENASIRKPQFIEIGNHVILDCLCHINVNVRCKLGDYTHLGVYSSIAGREFESEPFAVIATGARILCGSDDYSGDGIPGAALPLDVRCIHGSKITMKRFSCVCTNAIVLADVTLAEGSIVSAGSIMTEDTKPWVIYGGIPALPLKKRKKENILRIAKEMGY